MIGLCTGKENTVYPIEDAHVLLHVVSEVSCGSS